MGEESDALSEQGYDEWAEEHCRHHYFEMRQKAKSFSNAVKLEVARQLKAMQIKTTSQKPRGLMAQYTCVSCGDKFTARVADRKRGWAKSCSKSCAAKHKDNVSDGRNRKYYGY